MGALDEHVTNQEVEVAQIERTATVDPVPDPIVVEGGLIVDTEGLKDTSGLNLAKDGCVSLSQSNLLAPCSYADYLQDRPHPATHRP